MSAILHFIFVVATNIFMFLMLCGLLWWIGFIIYMAIQIAKGKGGGGLPWL